MATENMALVCIALRSGSCWLLVIASKWSLVWTGGSVSGGRCGGRCVSEVCLGTIYISRPINHEMKPFVPNYVGRKRNSRIYGCYAQLFSIILMP